MQPVSVTAEVSVLVEWVSQIPRAPGALDTALGLFPEAAIGLVAAAVVVVAVRVLRGRRARGDRVDMALVPSEGFDPEAEEIIRFAGQLARSQSASSRVLMPAGGRAIRVSLVSAGEGQMAHLVSGPSSVESVLRRRPLEQVQAMDPDELLGSRPDAGDAADGGAEDEVQDRGGDQSDAAAGEGQLPAPAGEAGGQPPERSGSRPGGGEAGGFAPRGGGEPVRSGGRWSCLTDPAAPRPKRGDR